MIMTGKETFSLLIETPWIIFVLYWILGAIKTRATREKESAASRIAILVIEGTDYVLISAVQLESAFWELGSCRAPWQAQAWAWCLPGQALDCDLGPLSSGRVLECKDHHQGRPPTHPHRSLRPFAAPHRLRSGSGDDGLGPRHREWRCVLGVCLVLTGYWFKARKEEAMLSQQFGDAFREHQKHTGFLIPRFR